MRSKNILFNLRQYTTGNLVMNSRIIKGNPNQDEVIVKEGYRFIKPFERKYEVKCKGRWMGRKLLDTYMYEYTVPEDVCKDMIKKGLIKVNDEIKSEDYIFTGTEVLQYSDIRTDRAVINFDQIEVIHEDDLFFVINKPQSIPVHPKGRYTKNTLTYIIKNEYGMSGLRLLHRLDKVTSGVLLFGKTTPVAQTFTRLMGTNQVKKFYLARVTGRFPHDQDEPPWQNDPEIHYDKEHGVWHVTKSLQCVNERRGIYRAIDNNQLIPVQEQVLTDLTGSTVAEKYKTAHTLFRFLGYDAQSNTSLMFCAPITGRTHQLREHLRVLGHQIVHDDEHLVQDLTDTQRGVHGWRHKMEIFERLGWNNKDIIEHMNDENINEFLEKKRDGELIHGEFKIDLHAFHYCIKLNKTDTLDMMGLRKRPRNISEGKLKKYQEKSRKRQKKIEAREKAISLGQMVMKKDLKSDEKYQAYLEKVKLQQEQDRAHLELVEKKIQQVGEVPEESMMDFETRVLPEWCAAFQGEEFTKVLRECVEHSKQYAYKHNHEDDGVQEVDQIDEGEVDE
ncbi:bifunctional protein RIB2 [Acrasis kona]|uniref:Bifunctional protein RIB2 n=1 Tax=Acrasis kona TaxID=1008807 RepID=A0AAW2YZI3_9EUKA